MVISAYGQNYTSEWADEKLYVVVDPAFASCFPCRGDDMSSLMPCLSWFHVQLGWPAVISRANFVVHEDY